HPNRSLAFGPAPRGRRSPYNYCPDTRCGLRPPDGEPICRLLGCAPRDDRDTRCPSRDSLVWNSLQQILVRARSFRCLDRDFFGTISALSQAIDAKDGFTRGHADRVSRIAGAIAREMQLSEKQIEEIELAGMLHDIGKIGVEDQILMKPARLDPHEQELMRRH